MFKGALNTKMEENCVEDLLNRTEFVDQVIKIIKKFSDTNFKSVTDFLERNHSRVLALLV